LAMTESDRGKMTAREVSERHEEKMLQLGPVMERLQTELLSALVDRAFSIMDRQGNIPPPPPELEGVELKVEFISIMAQAQKMLGTSAIERLMSFAGNLAAVQPNIIDAVDTDQALQHYADMLGVPPDIVRSDEVIEKIRGERAKAQQEAQQAEQMMGAAEGAKTLAQADMEGDNALTRMVGNLNPMAAGGQR
jgi:hypothetical protein